ncbi:MAG: hypothetical protein IT431_18015 [Phycisphaerales bacterium]|nr:hypothetical protein [Phycisphaerales bacterium]
MRWRVADFVHAHRDVIKESFRARLASLDRSYYDSSDFFSTVQRRVDLIASFEGLQDAADVQRLLHDIMIEALTDHARATMRDRRLRRELTRDAQLQAEPSTPPALEPPEESRLGKLHFSAEELNLARLRASGMLHRQVAQALGLSTAAARTRWQRLVGKAREVWGQPGA